MKKTYALVGNWFYRPSPKGLSVFELDEDSGSLNYIDTFFKDFGIGTQAQNAEKNVTYLVNECEAQHGCHGGGGYVMAVRIDPMTGAPELLCEAKTLSSFPSYFCLDVSGEYGIATHMGNGSHITKIFKTSDGRFDNITLYDDAAVVLFRINADGGIGEICDVSVHTGDEKPGAHAMSHMHSVSRDRDGRLFFICDKGTDSVSTYHIDREKGKLVHLRDLSVEDGVIPRYSVFHPTLPLVYANNERLLEIFSYRVDFETGEVVRTARTSLLENPDTDMSGLRVEASDIILSQDGKHLYVAVRGLDYIAMLDVGDDGSLTLRQNIKTGSSPRGLCFTPDGRFLYSMNTESAQIAAFAVEENGMLRASGEPVSAPCPACMTIFSAEVKKEKK